MIIKGQGSIFEIRGKIYYIGGVVHLNDTTEYSGRKGIITEVRTGEDKETDNLYEDIYVRIGDDEVILDTSMMEIITK